jgi:hypothetical protein
MIILNVYASDSVLGHYKERVKALINEQIITLEIISRSKKSL